MKSTVKVIHLTIRCAALLLLTPAAFCVAQGSTPTFTDANWSSMGGIPGVDWDVYAAVDDSSGNLYVGGAFTTAGGSPASYIAKWDGHSWTTLGSGMNYWVFALAVWDGNLYAAGNFTTAGGIDANNIAKWNGSGWTALGPGLNDAVYALAIVGSNVYAGGAFTAAGESEANYIAKWDGSAWSALGWEWTMLCGRWWCRGLISIAGVRSQRRTTSR